MGSGQVPQAVQNFMASVMTEIVNPLLGLIFALALLYFVYGLFVFILNANTPAKREEGRQHLLWGVIGMLIMVSVFSIIKLALNTFKVQQSDLPAPTGAWFGS